MPAMISSIDSPLFATNQTRISNRGKEGQIWRFKHLKWQIFPNTGLQKIIKKSTKKLTKCDKALPIVAGKKPLSSTLSTPNRLQCEGQIVVAFAEITIMAPLSTLVLPLPPHTPPSGYGLSDRPLSALSTTTVFYTGLNQQDQFLGECRCVICGIHGSGVIEHCHIIMDSEPHTVSQNSIWALLRLMWDTVEWPQGPQLDPWAGQSCTLSWTTRWHDYV